MNVDQSGSQVGLLVNLCLQRLCALQSLRFCLSILWILGSILVSLLDTTYYHYNDDHNKNHTSNCYANNSSSWKARRWTVTPIIVATSALGYIEGVVSREICCASFSWWSDTSRDSTSSLTTPLTSKIGVLRIREGTHLRAWWEEAVFYLVGVGIPGIGEADASSAGGTVDGNGSIC